MPTVGLEPLEERKRELRRRAYRARDAQINKDKLSWLICEKFVHLSAYQAARTVMWYVDIRSEVRTRTHLAAALGRGKRIVIPYCAGDLLRLWHLQDLDELVTGSCEILEPPPERWNEPGKRVDVKELDLIMVPGVGFDRHGGRLGNGQGYYDRLLIQTRPDALRVGVCFESQLFDEVATGPHDVSMHKVITEKAIYPDEEAMLESNLPTQ